MSADDRSGGSAALTRRQREARDARVFADRRRGLSCHAIEERHGIFERQGRRIVDRIAERRPAIEIDADAVVRELLEHYAQGIEDLALLVDSPNAAVRVAASRSSSAACSSSRSWALLPADWRAWRHGLEARHARDAR